MKNNYWEKTKKYIVWFLIIFLVGGFGGLIIERYVAPYLSSLPVLNKIGFLHPNNPIVITKTEQIRVNENVRVRDLVKQLTPQTALILGGRGQVGQNFEEQERTSGVILSSDGVIGLNESILNKNYPTYVVILNNGQVLPLEILSSDSKSSLSLIKVDASNLSAVNFGNSYNLEVGQQLLVLNSTESPNSIQFLNTYVARATEDVLISEIFSSDVFRQTFVLDKEINSGQLIFNLHGELTGISVADGRILPSEAIRSAQEIYFNEKEIIRPLMGINYIIFSKAGSDILGAPVSSGIILRAKGSRAAVWGEPAITAGLKEGDLVYKINNEEITTVNYLDRILNKYKPGDILELSVYNQGVAKTIELTLGEN